jgi:hypothetical protein
MLTKLRKVTLAAAMAALIGAATVAVPDTAHARWGGWHRGGGMAVMVVGAGAVSAWV